MINAIKEKDIPRIGVVKLLNPDKYINDSSIEDFLKLKTEIYNTKYSKNGNYSFHLITMIDKDLCKYLEYENNIYFHTISLFCS